MTRALSYVRSSHAADDRPTVFAASLVPAAGDVSCRAGPVRGWAAGLSGLGAAMAGALWVWLFGFAVFTATGRGALGAEPGFGAGDPWMGAVPATEFVTVTGRYRLVEGSSLSELSPVLPGARPLEIRGELSLRYDGSPSVCPLLLRASVRFETRDPEPHAFSAKGEGTLRFLGPNEQGEFDRQRLRLDLWISRRGEAPRLVRLDSGAVSRVLPSPWISAELRGEDSSADPTISLRIELVAVPWPEVFFSTAHGFTPGTGAPPVSDGDLLEVQGAVAIPFPELAGTVGVREPVGLDAVSLRFDPAADDSSLRFPALVEVFFSFEREARSDVLGTIFPADVLSSTGAVRLRGKDWMRTFGVQPVATDLGLDALGLAPDGRLVFSANRSFFSASLGRIVSSGDLIAEDGTVYRTERELYQALAVSLGVAELPGVDALYIWPHGEVWFSPERDFESLKVGLVRHGDLLSEVGRVVARNGELLAAFSPLEELADFGLDALSLNAAEHFSECGFLVQGVECPLFEADSGRRYVLADRGGFVPGDYVRVEGLLVSPCTTFCGQGEGCILGRAVERCEFDGCGVLMSEGAGCVVFRADSGRRFLLENLGAYAVGDRVRVRGLVVSGCDSSCLQPCTQISKNLVGPCVLETCGQIVDLGDGCVALETVDGKRYALSSVGEFSPSDAVFVTGSLQKDFAICGPCAGKPDVVGCLGEEEVESTGGPVGEVGFFRRADCNADGSMDLSDVIFGLMGLFSGGPKPPCSDACDSNGDAELNVTDPVYTLLFLFRGGPSPVPPFPGCAETKLRVRCGSKPCPCEYPEATCGMAGI